MDEILKLFTLKIVDAQMIIVSALLFVIFWRLFARVFFNPYLRLVEEREGRTSGAMHKADDDLKNAIELEAVYSERIDAARVQGMKLKLQLLEEAKKESARIIEIAQQEADVIKGRGKEALKDTTEKLLESFPQEVDKLSTDIIRQVTSDNITIV